MLTNNAAFKYETPYNSPFKITNFWTNGKGTLQFYAIINRYNMQHIKPYTSDTNIFDNKC